MTRAAALFALAVALASSLVLQTAARRVSVSCVWTHLSGDGDEVQRSFLLSDPGLPSASPRLYHASWRRSLLRSCAWSDDAAVLRSYAALCRQRARGFSEGPDDGVNVTSVVESEGMCEPAASLGERAGKGQQTSLRGHSDGHPQGAGERSEVRSPQRVKRGFIVPGTLWCGSGNKAPSHENLGVFSETDKCCREHDQCKHTITSFHIKFGIFNGNIFTMSHCDCDNKFHSCLMQAQDSISDAVGYTFFNVLKMHCFEFSHRLQCAQRNWFGMCKESKMSLYAEVHPPRPYNSSDPDLGNSTGWAANATEAAGLLPAGTTQPQLLSVAAAAAGYRLPALPSIAPGRRVSTPTAPNAPRGQAMLRSCAAYKDLDDCKAKILPRQRRYGFHNTEAQTLYHCNCTTRLFQTLADQTQLSEVQALLLGHVALSCFMPHNCTAGVNCTAELRKAPLPELDQRSGAGMEEQHHLEAMNLKPRGLSFMAANRNQRAFTLRKLCVRIVRSKLRKTRPRVQTDRQPRD